MHQNVTKDRSSCEVYSITNIRIDVFMVLVLDGHLEIGARVWIDLGYLICVRRLFRSRGIKHLLFQKRLIILHTCATCFELPSKINNECYNVVN